MTSSLSLSCRCAVGRRICMSNLHCELHACTKCRLVGVCQSHLVAVQPYRTSNFQLRLPDLISTRTSLHPQHATGAHITLVLTPHWDSLNLGSKRVCKRGSDTNASVLEALIVKLPS